jgi:hypothetical protein
VQLLAKNGGKATYHGKLVLDFGGTSIPFTLTFAPEATVPGFSVKSAG